MNGNTWMRGICILFPLNDRSDRSQLEKLSIVQNEQEKGMKYAFNVPENNDESRLSVAYNS